MGHVTPSSAHGATWRWLALTALLVLVAAAVPLLHRPRYYFLGDTQVAYYPQWFELGQKLRSGEWPLLDPAAWHGGNFVAEGQWSLFSPLVMAFGLGATVVPDAVVYVTVIKLALLVTAAVGTFLLARSYGMPRAVAHVAGLAVTLGGTTQYFDAPEWAAGLIVWALLPWAWWTVRRTLLGDVNPAPALAVGLLIVTVGYVYGTLYLIVVLLACVVDGWVSRNRAGVLRVLLVGVCCGLVAVTVYLPGVLTAPVTTRAGAQLVGSGALQADLPGLVGSMIPTVVSPSSPEPGLPGFPAQYIAWFLPVLVWLDVRRARAAVRPALGLLVVVGVGLLWALGPNQVGPLRWPIRMMPFLTLAVVVLTAYLWSRAVPARPSAGRLAGSLAVLAGAGYLVVARFPEHVAMTMISVTVVAAGLVATWLLRRRKARVGLALFVSLWSVGIVVLQHQFYPQPTAVDRNMPAAVSAYASAAAGAQGDVMVVGSAEDAVVAEPGAVRDILMASSWYLNPHPVANTYSAIGFKAYNLRYGLRFDGATYPDVNETLLSREPRTGAVRADLLAVSTMHFVRREQTDARVVSPPTGWWVSDQTPYAVTWVRDRPVPGAGGVVWSSPGLAVTELARDSLEVRVRVDQVPGSGGTLVLSRLAWPGYRVTSGTLAAPTDGYLVTVDVPPVPGAVVTVRFSPPGWTIEVVAGWTGVGLALLWSVGAAGLGRRSRRQQQAGQSESAAAVPARSPDTG